MRALLITFFLLILTQLSMSQTISEHIHIDQFGYKPVSQKIAVLSNPQVGYNSGQSYSPSTTMQVVDSATTAVIFSSSASAWNGGATHTQSGDQVWWFDFSAVTAPGTYYILDSVHNLRSFVFEIGIDVYKNALRESVRALYYQRCGMPKTTVNGGNWNDSVCHNHANQDLDCRLISNPTNTLLSKNLSGGWHDAGDYNKYVNFSHDPIHDLLFAFEDKPGIWGDDFNIPESGNGTPDILDEIKVELDWLLKMQELNGSVLMKVSVSAFQSTSPPSADMAARMYGPAQASSTRAFASMLAHAAIVYQSQGMTVYADTLLARAQLAWDWITANPAYSTYNNAGFSSANPEVSSSTQDDYLISAAAYLFAATADTTYQNYFDANYMSINPYSWTYWYLFQSTVQDALLYYAALPNATNTVAANINNSFITSMHSNNVNMLTAFTNNTDAYRANLADNDYVWGNNREKNNAASMYLSLIKYGLNNGGTNDSLNYINAASGYLHFLHGVNPINKSMLSNMYSMGGDNCANEIYHGWFHDGTAFDNALTSTYGPPPGILTGGINPNYSPDAAYSGPVLSPPQNQPIQKSFKDWNTAWPENSWEVTENAITYQAAYVNMVSKFVENSNVPLGIHSFYFDATLLANQQVELRWEVATTDIKNITIEKSSDLINWNGLKFIPQDNFTFGKNKFVEYDAHPNRGINYYRITYTTINGDKYYSNIQNILFRNKTNQISIFPNPSRDIVNVQVSNNSLRELEIYNILGRLVLTIKLTGTMSQEINIADLSKGIYYLKGGNRYGQFIKY